MRLETVLVVSILSFVTPVFTGCKDGGDANQATQPTEL
jgi:hypothetical protein